MDSSIVVGGFEITFEESDLEPPTTILLPVSTNPPLESPSTGMVTWSFVTPKERKSSSSPQTVTHCSSPSNPRTATQPRTVLFKTRTRSSCPALTATASKCSTRRGTTLEILAAGGLVTGSWKVPQASPSTSSTTWLSWIGGTTDFRSSPQRGSSSLPSEEKELNSVSSLILKAWRCREKVGCTSRIPPMIECKFYSRIFHHWKKSAFRSSFPPSADLGNMEISPKVKRVHLELVWGSAVTSR